MWLVKPGDAAVNDLLLSELTLAWLDAAGVNGALLFPVDRGTVEAGEWAQNMSTQMPDRFGWIRPAFPWTGPVPVEQAIRDSAGSSSRQLGWRLSISSYPDGVRAYHDGAFDGVFRECEAAGLPLFTYLPGDLQIAHEIASRYPDLKIILDHTSLSPQSPLHEPYEPWYRDLPKLLDVARNENVFVKLSGILTYSDSPYPHDDLWPHVSPIIDAYGAQRVMWGSDISRIIGRLGFRQLKTKSGHPGLHTYAESVNFIRDTDKLTEEQKSLILGETLMRVVKF
ncbi:amidohydrolase family protein [Rhodococcus sp. WAY2]|uniref:amidohydrolase family protein n=1 Tax=Rhodococcus sp. WAY2 TaxID=2663121 RepID=UPI00135B87DA|nr:amidohydrolase family protein [Rhodococcus sp. WAY2]